MTRIQLSDAQAVILSTACARGDGTVFPVTTGLKGGAVGNVCKSLLKRGLIEEVAATDLDTVWRHDEERGPITLRATPLACSTLGITEDPEGQADGQPASAPAPEPARRRTGTKQEALIAMLRAPEGAHHRRDRRSSRLATTYRQGRHFRRAEKEARPRRSPPRRSTEEVGRTASRTAEPSGQMADHRRPAGRRLLRSAVAGDRRERPEADLLSIRCLLCARLPAGFLAFINAGPKSKLLSATVSCSQFL